MKKFSKRLVCVVFLFILNQASWGVTFTNNAALEIQDPLGGLSWSTNAPSLSLSCWLKISVPSGANITEDMVALVDRRGGTESDPHAYLIKFDVNSGTVLFSSKGTTATFSETLVEQPYLDRWYHVAIVRQQDEFTGYVDGRQIFKTTASIGNSGNGDGVSIGGWAGGKYFFGEIQEVAIYRTALSQEFIVQNLFSEQPAIPQLRGYFKLGYSTNSADNLRNFAPLPIPSGTSTATKQGTGNVQFEEVNQAGEQSYFDSQKDGARNTLVPLSGVFSFTQTVLNRPTPGIAFELRMTYSSANGSGGAKLGASDPYTAGPVGKGWRHVFETRILPSQVFSPLADTDTVGLMNWDGSLETWDRNANSTNVGVAEYRTRAGLYRGELTITPTNCIWITPERLTYLFRLPDSGPAVMRGRLFAIRDFNGNSIQLRYDEILGQLTNVLDTAGGQYGFFHTNGLLRKITFGEWALNLTYDPTNRLVALAKTNSSGRYATVNTTWQFSYNGSNNFLERVIDPRGNTSVLVAYDQFGRQTTQMDGLGFSTRFEYGVPEKRQIRRTDQEGRIWLETFDRRHRLLSRKDPYGNETQFRYDEASNPISIVEPQGYITSIAYDQRANIVATTNALGEVSRRVIHPFFNKGIQEVDPLGWTNFIVIDDVTGNLLRNHDSLGELARYTYGTNGVVEASADGNSNLTRLSYDTNGFAISRTDAAGNVTRYLYNELGWKLAETNALGEVTTFDYDLNGNVVKTIDPLARTLERKFDGNGNLVSNSDAKGNVTTYAFNPLNQRTQMVDRAGYVWRYTYSPRGQPQISFDPLGFGTTNYYDFANRLVATSDPLGNTVSNIYDANGKIVAMVDQLGRHWSKVRDTLGRVIIEADPEGNTKRTTYDPAGRIEKVTNPNGAISLHEYDGRARLKKWIDPEGFIWQYDYDGIQNITNITDALSGHYVMRYGPRNERLLERNQDGFEWNYTYDAILRLKQQRDPNGITRALEYDAGGRTLSVTFNSGRVDSFLYDDNNNPEVLSRSGSGPATLTTLKYDGLDRVVESSDAFGKKVKFGFDARGLRTTVTYPDLKILTNSYDGAGRLSRQTDWAGRQCFYGYDKIGRLIRRTYPNGVVQTNTFDEAGRLTGLTYSSVAANSNSFNAALSYAYDRNGNKVGWSESGTIQWPLPSLTDEKARFTQAGRILDRQILSTLSNQVSTVNYYHDSSGNMTNAVGAGQSWSVSYDEDNRATSILWDAGITEKAIVNRYDALGRRVAKTVDGVETRYSLDLAGGMERVLCDIGPSSTITTWYVHGPDLAYRVEATGRVICFHADAQGNVIALSDGNTNVVAQYAYSPYGRSMGNGGSAILNPYLFVGSQGVIEDAPGLYFMRARYYSPETASFLSTDPLKNIGPGGRTDFYTYVNGNPLSFIDPTGLTGLDGVVSLLAQQHAYNWIGGGYAGGGNRSEAELSKLSAEELGTLKPPLNLVDATAQKHDWDIAGAYQIDSFQAIIAANSALYNNVNIAAGKELLMGHFNEGATGLAMAFAFKPRYSGISMGDVFNAFAWRGSKEKGLTPFGILGLEALKNKGLSRLTAKSPAVAQFARLLNDSQATLSKLPTISINFAAEYAGRFAAESFGRILPKHTPPIVRTALTAAVQATVTSAVRTVLTFLPGPLQAIAVIASVFGLPKVVWLPLIAVAFASILGLWRSWRHRPDLLMNSRPPDDL